MIVWAGLTLLIGLIGPADTTLQPAVRVSPPSTSIAAPVFGDCESWRPLVEASGITDWPGALYVMDRETGGRCDNPHAYRRSTQDDSYGNFQINIWGRNAASWERIGFSRERLSTVEGSIEAAAVLWKACGWGPWTKPYDCWGDWPL